MATVWITYAWDDTQNQDVDFFTIEIRPRAGSWLPFFAVVPPREKNKVDENSSAGIPGCVKRLSPSPWFTVYILRQKARATFSYFKLENSGQEGGFYPDVKTNISVLPKLPRESGILHIRLLIELIAS